jgi:glycine dehydrogenase subunit 2
MKYNPKFSEDCAALQGFGLQNALCDLTGMDEISLQPAAGAHGEFAGLIMIREYFRAKGENARTKIIVPDSAHGTNPAGAAMCGFTVVPVKSDSDGYVDLDALRNAVGGDTAALMLTNPNTVGLFEKDIVQIAEIVHESGGLLYYDGANLNAIMGKTRPGDMGFDIIHLNLHKTFSTPHGGGGPGSGPVGCKKEFAQFLPRNLKNFYGNFTVFIKAYAYILKLGSDGLREVSDNAVLNANYFQKLLTPEFVSPFPTPCMHEFVISLEGLKRGTGVTAADFAKALIDRGIHPPTMYFPLIVPEAFMIEPTETESKETLEQAAAVFKEIYAKAYSEPDAVKNSPARAYIKRADELRAARNPIVRFIEPTVDSEEEA